MKAPQPAVPDTLSRLSVHNHACLIYDGVDEQLNSAIPFVTTGLNRGEYCGYIADENSMETIATALAAEHVDVDAVIRAGKLAFLSKRETYFRDGPFEPEKMVDFVRDTCRAAKEAGFPALRCTGEMTWQLGSYVSRRSLLVYEAKLNYLFAEEPLVGLCQYNLQRFSPEIIGDILKTHPFVIYKNIVCKNHYYIPPDELLAERSDPHGEVSRLLTTILDREQADLALQETVQAMRRSQEELVERIKELEQFHDAVVGREMKMIELEQRLADSLARIKTLESLLPQAS